MTEPIKARLASLAGMPNGIVPLEQTTAELLIAGVKTSLSASIVLRLSNEPGLIVELNGPSPFFIGGDFGENLYFPTQNIDLKGFVSNWRRTGCRIKASFVPSVQPIRRILRKRQRLAWIDFRMINFPDFFGQQDLRKLEGRNTSYRLGSTMLTAQQWTIRIAALPDLKQTVETLKRDGGYGLTHSGRLELASGRTFSIKEGIKLLEDLQFFLSFAGGSFTSTALAEGFSRRGERIWESWGTYTVTPWSRPPSWFDTMNGHVLSEVFPGYWTRINDPKWRQTIRTVLYWYLRSNRHGHGAGVDGGLILSQAALERLAYAHGCTSGSRAAPKIRTALQRLAIPTTIPKEARALRRLAQRHKWDDGVHAITEVRNDLIHPKAKYGDDFAYAYFEAWNLAQLYIELMLLHLFDYRGAYGNRITQEWRGQVHPVPWV